MGEDETDERSESVDCLRLVTLIILTFSSFTEGFSGNLGDFMLFEGVGVLTKMDPWRLRE